MNDDVKKYIYGTLILFLVGVLVWVGFVYLNACGFTLSCNRGARLADTTPVPTLIPAALPVMAAIDGESAASEKCSVAATDLIGAWVEAGASDTEPFEFTDTAERTCEASFEDVQPLFVQSNLWYAGSRSCVNCHVADVAISSAQLDLTGYEGILAGSRRADEAARGTDILGGGKWDSSLLYQFLAEAKDGVPGHEKALSGLMILAGTPLSDTAATPTP